MTPINENYDVSNKSRVWSRFHFLFSVHCNAVLSFSGLSSSLFKYGVLISGQAPPDLEEKLK